METGLSSRKKRAATRPANSLIIAKAHNVRTLTYGKTYKILKPTKKKGVL